MHRARIGRHGDPHATKVIYDHPETCSVKGCEKPYRTNGYCNAHNLRANAGLPLDPPIRAKAPHGSGYTAPNGYRYIYVDGKRVLEHRHVMEQALGRPLLPDESVHHKGPRDDNRPHKLELRVKAHGSGWTIPEAVAWAREILKRYES